jgi:hypothetical protein
LKTRGTALYRRSRLVQRSVILPMRSCKIFYLAMKVHLSRYRQRGVLDVSNYFRVSLRLKSRCGVFCIPYCGNAVFFYQVDAQFYGVVHKCHISHLHSFVRNGKASGISAYAGRVRRHLQLPCGSWRPPQLQLPQSRFHVLSAPDQS